MFLLCTYIYDAVRVDNCDVSIQFFSWAFFKEKSERAETF